MPPTKLTKGNSTENHQTTTISQSPNHFAEKIICYTTPTNKNIQCPRPDSRGAIEPEDIAQPESLDRPRRPVSDTAYEIRRNTPGMWGPSGAKVLASSELLDHPHNLPMKNEKKTSATNPDSLGPVDRTSWSTGTTDSPGYRGGARGSKKIRKDIGRKLKEQKRKNGTDKGSKTHTPKDTDGIATETNTKTITCANPDSLGHVDRTLRSTGTTGSPGHRGGALGNKKTKKKLEGNRRK